MQFSPTRLAALVATHGSPLMLIAPQLVQTSYRNLQTELPRVRLYYAVKSNPEAQILRALRELGSGFDIASSGEWAQVAAQNVSAQDVIYTNPVKAFGEIERLTQAGISVFFYDNEAELSKIAQAAPNSQVILRLSVVNPQCVVDLGEKFGALPTQAESLLEKAVNLGLKPLGLSFHVGSQSAIPQPYVDMIEICKRIFNQMALRGLPLKVLDIGGGFPVSYRSSVMRLDTYCKPIREALNSYFPNTTLWAEPGRILSAGAATLVTRVMGKARRKGITWYYLDDGIYGSFSGRIFDHAHYEFSALRQGEPQPCVLAGPTCDSFDVISRDEFLPELEVGDMVLAHNMGAYTNASASAFNGIPITPVLPITP